MITSLTHYYGDTIRKLFIAAAVLMLISLPFFQNLIPFPVFASLLGVLVIVLGAGFIAPKNRWLVVINLIISATAMLTFEYYAISAYLESHIGFFVANQILAIIFLAASYYGAKTVRGIFSEHYIVEEHENDPGEEHVRSEEKESHTD